MNYYEQTERYLRSYIQLKASIENMKKEINEILINDGVTAINYNKEKTAETYRITHPTEKTAINNVMKIDKKKRDIEATKSKLERIDNAIKTLEPVDQDIIKLRYVEGYQWFVVARNVGYSESHCRLRALNAVEKISIALFGDKAMTCEK